MSLKDPTLDLRPGRLNVPVWPGNAHTIELTWPADVLDGTTWTATVDGETVTSATVSGDTLSITFTAPTTLGKYDIVVTETTPTPDSVRIAGIIEVSTSTRPSDSTTTIPVTVSTATGEVTVNGGVAGAGGGGGGGVTDHGALSGLADDDHTQYALADGSRGTFEVAGAVAAHEADTTAVHGISDTSALRTATQIQALIDAATAALIDTAPGTLDTLNELAAALGDDPNFATTVAADIAAKVAKSTFDANSLLVAHTDDTPEPLVVAEGRIVGRLSGGQLAALTAAQFRTLLNVEDGATADQTAAEIKTAYESNADTNPFTDAEQTKLAGVEAGATADQTGAEIKAAYEAEADTNAYTDADKTKVGHLTVTQPVDLDSIESRVNDLDAAVVLQGAWDASVGSFPGGGTAQAGHAWVVSVAGTVDGVDFQVNDRLLALVDNAPTGVYADNWLKLDYTDAVLSVDGRTGAVTLSDLYDAAGSAATVQGNLDAHTGDATDAHDASAISFAPAGDLEATDVQAALEELDTEKAAAGHTHSGASPATESADFTLSSTHSGKVVRCTKATQQTVTIPTDATDDLPDGYETTLFAEGAGGLTLSTTGITLAGSSPNTTISQNEGLFLKKTATADTWIVMGGTAA